MNPYFDFSLKKNHLFCNKLEFTSKCVMYTLCELQYFPFLFFSQSIKICIELRKISRKYNKSIDWWKSFLISLLICFANPSAVAFITNSIQPLLRSPVYVPCFIMIWFLVNCSFSDYFYRFIVNSKILSFLLNIINYIITTRELIYGYYFGKDTFKNCISGSLMTSIISTTTGTCVWVLVDYKIKEYYASVCVRNILYCILFSILDRYFNIEIHNIASYFFCFLILFGLLNSYIYGIGEFKSLDNSLINLISNILPYYGNHIYIEY